MADRTIQDLEAQRAIEAERLKMLDDETAKSEKLLEIHKLTLEIEKKRADELEKEIIERKKSGELSEKQLQRQIKLLDLSKERVKEQEKILKNLAEQEALLGDIASSTESLLNKLGLSSASFERSLFGKLAKLSKEKGGLAAGLREMGKTVKTAISPANLFTQSLQSMGAATAVLIYEQENALSGFNRSTGAAGEYDDAIVGLGKDHRSLGIDTAEAAKAFADLRDNFSEFTYLSKNTQREVAKFTATMNELGISSDVVAESFNISVKALGLTTEQAMMAQKEIFAVATELGVSTQRMAKDFQEAAPQLAAFGDKAIEKFKELSVVAKNTGIQMSQLLSTVEQFDTFEGAANAVGRLNAILGGPFLNSMELVQTTDPTERLLMLQKAVNQAGQSWETMNYYQRRAIASAAGIKDVATAAQLFTSDLQKNAAAARANALSQEEMNKRAADVQTIMDKLKQTFMAFAISMRPVIDGVTWLIDGFLKLNESLGGYLVPALTGVLGIWTLLTKFGFLGKAAGKAVDALADGIGKVGANMKTSTPSMLAFGAAVLLISGGIAVASLGIAKLAESLKGMTGPEFAMLGGILLGMGVGIALLASVSVAAATPLLALGAAFLLIGGGIALVGYGISNIANSLKGMTDLFGAMSINVLATAAVMPILAIGFGALAISLALIKTSDLMAVGEIFASLATFSSATALAVEGVAQAIKEMVSAIDELPTVKTIAMTALVNAVGGTATNTVAAGNMPMKERQPIIIKLEERTIKKVVVDIVNNEFKLR